MAKTCPEMKIPKKIPRTSKCTMAKICPEMRTSKKIPRTEYVYISCISVDDPKPRNMGKRMWAKG